MVVYMNKVDKVDEKELLEFGWEMEIRELLSSTTTQADEHACGSAVRFCNANERQSSSAELVGIHPQVDGRV